MTADGGERSLGAPRFDVVLRGYDRRQVDEHVARLQRVLARMRADLDAARSNPFPAVRPPHPGMPPGPGGFPAGPQGGPPGSAPRPSPRPRPGGPQGGPDQPDMIGSFTDRMQSILQAAEDEAEEIRAAARREVRAETEAARQEKDGTRQELAELNRQRDAVVAELTRLRGQLEGMLAAPTARFAVTSPREVREADERPGARPSPRPKSPEAGAPPVPGTARPQGGDETTVVRRPGGELFRTADGAEAEPATAMVPVERPGARPVEPDRTMAVSAVQRSGDTGSAEKSERRDGRPESETPGDTPVAKGDQRDAAKPGEVTETVKVNAVRPAPGPGDSRPNGRNGRSGHPDEGRGGGAGGERNGSGGSSEGQGPGRGGEGSGRPDRSASGSRSG